MTAHPTAIRSVAGAAPGTRFVRASAHRAAASGAVRDHAAVHWPEYAIEAVLLATFMVSACTVTVLLEHPASPIRTLLPDPFVRRALAGAAMGLTAIALIYSPWGRQSGAHFNPSVTLTFWRLGKIAGRDAIAYVGAQCAGGIAGVLLAWLVLGMLAAHPAVAFAATVPGAAGPAIAFAAETAISFVLMAAVLLLANGAAARWTGVVCGTLVALFITFEAPYSGMSMNPARTLASALAAQRWTALWIYAVAPPLGMLAAAELYLRLRGARRVVCAKLHHDFVHDCIFRCGYAAAEEGGHGHPL
jgi:aquaporin Z